MKRRSVRPKGGDRKRDRTLRVLLGAAAALVILPVVAHLAVVRAARLDAPRIDAPALGSIMTSGSVRRLGRAYVRRVEGILEARLVGSPEAIGTAHSRLLYEDMVATEGSVWQLLDGLVPSRAAQVALLDLAQWRYRNVARGVAGPRLREIAAAARGFAPDPFSDRFDTFQRFIYLSALYDISLAFEHSPLIGCTTFVFSGAGAAPLLARAFDFEAHPVFDERKAVFLVLEDGKIPYASVAWPGLVGVVSGMNREGLAVVVHGARAGDTRTVGEPVVHALRRVLGTARTTQEAISALDTRDAMVSHIVVVMDALGHAAAIERIPDRPAHIRALGSRAVVTNHLEGPAAADPKNDQVRRNTSTLARRARGDELLKAASGPVTEADAVRLLRDRKGAGGRPLPLGDRRAIDALIATHGVVVNTRERVLWVSRSPHLLGSFVAFELNELLRRDYEPGPDPPPRRSIDADPLLRSGQPLPHARGVLSER